MSAPGADRDFAARVGSAIRASQVPHDRRRHWAQYVGGGAIAAGVAVAALMLNVPGARVGAPAPVAETQPAPTSAVATSPARISPAPGAPFATGLLSRQPTVFGAQPASANVVYGTGLMQPEYLQRATYARDAVPPYASFQTDQPALPFSIVLLPEQPSADASAPRH